MHSRNAVGKPLLTRVSDWHQPSPLIGSALSCCHQTERRVETMARLKLTSGDENVEHELPSDATPMTLGRARDNMWELDDEGVSRRHAEISATEDGYVIRDLGSSNGTWVNRTRIERHVLSDGDEITIGTSTLVFSEPTAEKATVMVDMANFPEPPPPASPAFAPPPPDVPPPPPPVSPKTQTAEPAPPPVTPSRPPLASESPPTKEAPKSSVLRTSSARVTPAGAVGLQGTFTGWLGGFLEWLSVTPDPPRPDAGQVVGFGPRLGAYLIDAVILFIVTFVLMFPLGLIGALIGSKIGIIGALFGLTGWVLGLAVSIGYLLVPWAQVGVTPGKRLLGLKVVNGDGTEPLGYGKAAMRMVGYMASGLLFCAGFIMIAFTRDNRGLHDMIADTKVVRS